MSTSVKLARFIVKRLIGALFVIAAVTMIVFFVQRVLPVDPVDNLVGPYRTDARLDEARRQLGLDKPLQIGRAHV